MTVHLISVGVSVLVAMEHPDPKKFSADLIEAFNDTQAFSTLTFDFSETERKAASRWVASALPGPDEPEHEPARARHLRDIAGELDIGQWPPGISAEIETLRYASGKGQAFPLDEDDIAILICSDTPKGLLAAVWNALGLVKGDFSRVAYLPDPDQGMGKIRGKAVIARVEGMDAANSDRFRDAMKHLGALACGLFESQSLTPEDDFRFYLSGGFKAAIPYLIGMAEAIRSLDEVRLAELGVVELMPESRVFPVKAFVMHEMSDPPKPIELPLRRLIATAIRRELAGFVGGICRGALESTLLEGYAYETLAHGNGYQLTPFGEGLATLFSRPAESHGG
jgi:hypothetical protein